MKDRGFTIFETVVVLVMVAIIAAAGYGVYKKGHPKAASTAIPASSQSTTATNVSTPPQVTSTSDLTKAEQTLNQNDPSNTNTSDSSQLDNQLSSF